MTSRGYIIQWTSKVNGRAGRGTKEFVREEAEQLAEELNEEYPEIHHAAVKVKAQLEANVVQLHQDDEHLVKAE